MAIVYRGTVSSYYRTNNMLNFQNNVVNSDTSDSSLYLIIGRNESWAANENDVGFSPPYPQDAPSGYADIWQRALGFIKIDQSATVAIYPRRDWGDPSLGASAFQFQIGDIVCTNTATYNHSTGSGVDSGIMVYKCVEIPSNGSCSIDNIDTTTYPDNAKDTCIGLGGTWTGPDATNIPTGKGTAINTEDGYYWEYMYTIPPSVVISDVTDDYIVVPFPEDIEQNGDAWGLDTTISENYDVNRTIYELKTNLLRFKVPISTAQFPDLADPAANGFRQISIIYTPILKKTTYDEPSIVASDNFYLPDDLQQNSGEMLYLENRQPIFKSTYQEELITITFQF